MVVNTILFTGLPQHQNGMYGLHHEFHHFQSFDEVHSLPLFFNKTGGDYWYGIIGKKHIGPDSVYPFPFSYTEQDGYNLNQVGRNITLMNEFVRKFFTEAQQKEKPFFLYIAFFDVHQGCGGIFGEFCDYWGNGSKGMGTIPDWTPVQYTPEDVEVPSYLPDTPITRAELTGLYHATTRMDQGVELFLKSLQDFGYENNTLVILTADNGIPYPNAKTNLYEPGVGEPMIISNPMAPERWGQETEALASTTDIVPTILDWFDLKFPDYKIFGSPAKLLGKSLLPILESEPTMGFDTVFTSQNFHEVTEYYPMRGIRDKHHRLIHNLNFKMPFPIVAPNSPIFADILNKTLNNVSTHWFKTMHDYYYRGEFELFDLDKDPLESKNMIDDPAYQDVAKELKDKLWQWLVSTNDPWLCMPGGEKVGHDKCSTFLNGL